MNREKISYDAAALEVIAFDVLDVIATSGTVGNPDDVRENTSDDTWL